MQPTRWWWIRHAPIQAARGTIAGQLDLSCDTAQPAVPALARQLPDAAQWIVTPLQRTSQTWKALIEAGAAGDPARVEPDLMEQHFGVWQGETYATLDQRGGAAYRAFWDDPVTACPPDGESFQTMTARVQTAILRLSEAFAGRDVVAVAHAGPVRAALGLALGLDGNAMLSIQIDTLSLTRIDYFSASSWRIVRVNLTQDGGS